MLRYALFPATALKFVTFRVTFRAETGIVDPESGVVICVAGIFAEDGSSPSVDPMHPGVCAQVCAVAASICTNTAS